MLTCTGHERERVRLVSETLVTCLHVLGKKGLAEREGFEPSVQVLARTTV
jgi:hypothetical protein